MAYLPLSTANLPDPAINPAQGSSPTDYFNTVLWTGDDVVGRSITGVGFQPDFSWVKCRNTARNHGFWDAVRGAGYFLSSNLTDAETDRTTAGLTSFISDGFTVGAGSEVNNTGETYVGWNWKANGSGVSNTDGSITSTVSANTESGFSIVTYTGVSGGGTVGHGLGAKPSCIIVKNRSQADNWWIWHQGMESSGENGEDYLFFTTAASADDGYQYLANNSTTFTPQGTSKLMQDGGNFVAYCWSEIENFSKFGSYTGNGNADGSFVYTGFRPAFVLIKRTNAASNWLMYDTKRNTYNLVNYKLFADTSTAENVSDPAGVSISSNNIDILSNGFKHRNADSWTNQSGDTYIYMAFAENPFKYSNAR
jgi:hypothetical protein